LNHALQMPEHDTCIDAAAYVRRLCLSISRSTLDHMQIDRVLAACPLPLQRTGVGDWGDDCVRAYNIAAWHAFAGVKGIRVELLRRCMQGAGQRIGPGNVQPDADSKLFTS